ncbi:MAG: ribonuclease J [Patescibacteria group bacterium]|nr:ribonuclease J [Patescibacteria group bacterium]
MTSRLRVRFVPLGGLTEVTKNMYLYELYEDTRLKDILIIDCGIGFPKEKELGVDLVIPDISYLEDKKDKIRAILLTHGHEDHIGALPFLYNDLGRPPVFASKLTSVFLENKFRERNDQVFIERVNFEKTYDFGGFKVNFIRVTHSIPDTTHIVIRSPVGNFYHGSDFKLDLTPPYGPSPDFYQITKAGYEGVLCLLSDCLGSEREGLTLSESVVGRTFEEEMRKTKGKFIMTTFSSNISRIRQCVEAAIKFNRKIIFLGRSMKESTRLASEIGYLPIPRSLIASEEDLTRLPPNRVCLVVAGSQAQYGSAMTKLADRQNPYTKVGPGDKVIFSSDPIPGNEDEVYELIEELVSQGANVYYSDIADQLHSSGHGNQEDLKFLIRFTKPQYFIPIGGTIRHQHQYRNLVDELGFDRDRVFCLIEGETVVFYRGAASLGETIPTRTIYLDAYGVDEVASVVLRDRKTLSTEGIVIVVIVADKQGSLITRPKVFSRGFVFEKEQDFFYQESIKIIESVMRKKSGRLFEINNVKREIISLLEEFFFNQKRKTPLIVVEIITL